MNAIIRDCIGLSAGTMAKLIGRPDYESIDAARDRLVAFAVANVDGNRWACWQDVWFAFAAQT